MRRNLELTAVLYMEKVQLGNDQEMVQSERNSQSKNGSGKKLNWHLGTYTDSPLDEIKYVGYLRSSLHPPRYQGSYTSF